MHTKQPWLSLTIGLAAALAVAASSAASLGAGAASAVLGQPLDFAVNVRLDAGEPLGPECVAAEVTAGDRRIPPALVRTVVEATGAESARVRVLTQPSLDEPVIGVELSVGCTSRISRRYVVLADPPMGHAVAAAPSFAANPTPVPDAPAASPTRSADGADGAAASTATTAAAVAARPVRTAMRAPLDPAEAERRAQRRAERRAAAKAAKEARAARLAKAAQVRPARTAVAGADSTAPTPARLKLEVEEPAKQAAGKAAVEEALAAVAQAASAARAAASAASASAERMAGLERTVEQLRAEAQASRELAAQFRQRLTQAEGSSVWLLPLLVGVGLLTVLCGWLAWRLGQVQSQRQQVWREAVAAPAQAVPDPITETSPSRQPTSPRPFVTSELRPAAVAAPASRARTAHAWPPPAPPVAWPPPDSTIGEVDTEAHVPLNERTEPMPAVMGSAEDVARDVTIEELIDLEQQAEFFIVLGQEDAAIELLVEHLRSSGGGSPLPYLKLLEIHHRRNDRDAYERMRTRFNHRFNAYAPEWGVDLGTGRTLDDYPGVIPSLQAVWQRPLDAMAELEALLFRKSSGELFDLPAYREVLFLYSLARDLLDRGAADNGSVDLLLPMGSGAEVGSTARSPAAGLDRDAFRDTQINEDRTETLDFDVSASDRRTSIFDLLDEKPHTRPP